MVLVQEAAAQRSGSARGTQCHTLRNINRDDLNLQPGSTTIKPVRVVRDLGVLLDDELSLLTEFV